MVPGSFDDLYINADDKGEESRTVGRGSGRGLAGIKEAMMLEALKILLRLI